MKVPHIFEICKNAVNLNTLFDPQLGVEGQPSKHLFLSLVWTRQKSGTHLSEQGRKEGG